VGYYRGPVVTDRSGHLVGFDTALQCGFEITSVEIRSTAALHQKMGNLDAAETMEPTELEALVQITVDSNEVPARVSRICEPAEGLCFPLWRPCRAGAIEGLGVLLLAAVDLAQGKIQVAPEVMKLGELKVEAVGRSDWLSPPERRKSLIIAVDYAHAGGETDFCLATLRLIDSEVARFDIGLYGASGVAAVME
jgi:hypothetical protein